MSEADAQFKNVPWFKQRWPWILISLPATSVVVGMVFLYFAVTTWDGLVVDDYYRQGRAIDRTIARSVHAADLGLVADLSIRSDNVTVRLSATGPDALPESLIVTIAHPTRGGQDQILRLSARGEGVFTGPVAPLSTGRWIIQLEDESRTWRLNGAVYLPTETEKRIVPYDS